MGGTGSANCVRKVLFPPVKSCSVVRIRPEFSVSNFAGNCSFFQMDGSLLLAFKGRFFFSSTARKSFFSLNCPKGDSLLKCRKTIQGVRAVTRNVLIVKAGVVTISGSLAQCNTGTISLQIPLCCTEQYLFLDLECCLQVEVIILRRPSVAHIVQKYYTALVQYCALHTLHIVVLNLYSYPETAKAALQCAVILCTGHLVCSVYPNAVCTVQCIQCILQRTAHYSAF